MNRRALLLGMIASPIAAAVKPPPAPEQGTWTPKVRSASGNVIEHVPTGRWVRRGGVVTVSVALPVTARMMPVTISLPFMPPAK